MKSSLRNIAQHPFQLSEKELRSTAADENPDRTHFSICRCAITRCPWCFLVIVIPSCGKSLPSLGLLSGKIEYPINFMGFTVRSCMP